MYTYLIISSMQWWLLPLGKTSYCMRQDWIGYRAARRGAWAARRGALGTRTVRATAAAAVRTGAICCGDHRHRVAQGERRGRWVD